MSNTEAVVLVVAVCLAAIGAMVLIAWLYRP